MNGSTLRYLWLREKYFRLRRRGESFTLASHQETWLLSTADSVISPQLFASGEFDLNKLAAAIQVLKGWSLTTIIDVGAHVGSICIPAVSRGWFAGAIAIEPDPTNYSLLKSNLLLNSVADRVATINAPVGGIDGELLSRKDGGGNSGDHRFTPIAPSAPEASSSAHECIVLDSIVERIDRRGALLWMDIQGAEGLALSGAGNLLSLEIPVVLELDAKLLEPHGGLSVGFEMLSNYEGFVDLGSQLMQVIPTSQLKVFYRISRETGASYDLLFLPRKSGN